MSYLYKGCFPLLGTLHNSFRKVTPLQKSVFHICIWPSAGIAIATELLSVSKAIRSLDNMLPQALHRKRTHMSRGLSAATIK